MGRLNWMRLVILGLFLWTWLEIATPLHAQSDVPVVVTVRLEGALNPIWQETLKRAMRVAEDRGAEALILQLDTPGGQIDVMNRLVQQIRNSPMPVVVYVSPAGAMAASAGAMLTLAGHASAMAPETSIGAASPVGGQGEDIGETMESKVKEILKASARGLTLRRGETAVRLAEEMIENARAVSANEAVENGLVDVVASDLPTLLRKLDGLSVEFGDSRRTLNTAGAIVVEVPLTFMEQVLVVLANPNLVFLLLSIGVQAILIELSSPGGWVAGFIGAVCITFAVFGLGILPVNWFGIIFLVMAFILFVLDLQSPTHGALTAAGVASFIVGALVLFNSPNIPGTPRVSVPLVVGTGVTIGVIFFGAVAFALRAQRAPIRIGQEALLGQVGYARSDINPVGNVQLGSELWTAENVDPTTPIPRGSRVEVVRVEGIRLIVRRVN